MTKVCSSLSTKSISKVKIKLVVAVSRRVEPFEGWMPTAWGCMYGMQHLGCTACCSQQDQSIMCRDWLSLVEALSKLSQRLVGAHCGHPFVTSRKTGFLTPSLFTPHPHCIHLGLTPLLCGCPHSTSVWTVISVTSMLLSDCSVINLLVIADKSGSWEWLS